MDISHLANKWPNMTMEPSEIRRLRLRELIDNEYGGVDAAFAAAADVNSSYISRIFSDNPAHRRNLGEKLITRIVNKLRLPKAYFDTVPGQQNDAETQQRKSPHLNDIVTRVPLISWDQALNWDRLFASFDRTSASRLVLALNAGPRAFALLVEGDSMAASTLPTAPAGSVLIVDPDTGLRPHGLAVVVANDLLKPVFKQVIEDAGQTFLKSLNPAYPPILVNKNLRVCGAVLDIVQEIF